MSAGARPGSARISAVLKEPLRRLPLIVTTLSAIPYPFGRLFKYLGNKPPFPQSCGPGEIILKQPERSTGNPTRGRQGDRRAVSASRPRGTVWRVPDDAAWRLRVPLNEFFLTAME